MALDDCKIVNANNVDLFVDAEGTGEVVNTTRMVVDEFSVGTDSEVNPLSGVGNHDTQFMSLGDVTHNFSFTVQGEDAALMGGLARDDNGAPAKLDIRARGEDFDISLDCAFAETRDYGASTGDALEYEASGLAASVSEN
jgi:hypothetical protein